VRCGVSDAAVWTALTTAASVAGNDRVHRSRTKYHPMNRGSAFTTFSSWLRPPVRKHLPAFTSNDSTIGTGAGHTENRLDLMPVSTPYRRGSSGETFATSAIHAHN
jgi:hypothetical protein